MLNFSSEDNASLGFYGDAFGFKMEGSLNLGPVVTEQSYFK